MGKKSKLIYAVSVAILIMVSCNDNSKESGDIFPESIQGVWQQEDLDQGDEVGLYFTGNKLGHWNYMGDEHDEWKDCYDAQEFAELISREGDKYRIKTLTTQEEGEGMMTIEVEANMITTSYSDVEGHEIYTKDNRSVSDLKPPCSS